MTPVENDRMHSPSSKDLAGFLVCALIISAIIALFAELVVFNYRHWESLSYDTITYEDFAVGDGLEAQPDGAYLVRVDSAEEDRFIEIEGIDRHIDNLYINVFDSSNHQHAPGKAIPIVIMATDAANSTYMKLQSTELVYGVDESSFIRLHLVGTTQRLKICFTSHSDEVLDFSSIQINAVCPLRIRIWRLAFTLLLSFLLIMFLPRSPLYKIPLGHSPVQVAATAFSVFLDICIALAVFTLFENPYRETGGNITYLQYNYLADALIDGRTDLNIEAPRVLASLDNPYDTAARTIALNNAGEEAIMDLAYFEGKYYCYFGVVPALLFYVPWRLITGVHLSTSSLIAFLSCLLVPIIYWLHLCLIRRFSFKPSLGLYLLFSHAATLSCGLLYFMQISSLYSVPFVTSILFGSLGLSLWMKSIERRDRIGKGLLLFGSISIALVMGCRPQLSLVFLFAFQIFSSEIAHGEFFSKKGLLNTSLVIVPFLIVGICLMVYNNVRFGNPFDFGAQYNLTGFDMTHRGFIPQRFLLGTWEYYFQPLQVSAKFPYISIVAPQLQLVSDYQGQVINEPIIGGFFSLCPFSLWAFNIRSVLNKQDSSLSGLVLTALSLVGIVTAIDIQMVGITLRYHADFALLLSLTAILSFYAEMPASERNGLAHPGNLIIALCIASISLQLLALLCDGRANSLLSINPYAYWRIKYQLFLFFSIR